MQRADQSMAGQRGLHRDGCRGGITDFAEH